MQVMDLPITPILCQELAPHLGDVLTPEVLSRIVARVSMRCYPGPVDISRIAPQVVGSYTIECARIADLLPELRALHAAHWAETEVHRHGVVEMNPDYQRVLDLEAQGRYFLIVARHRDGQLVANYGSYLSVSSHTQLPTATEDTLFLDRAHRKGRLGVSIIRYAEDALRQLGIVEMNVSVKRANNVGSILERLGYVPVGTQFTKILTQPTKEAAHVLA